MTDDVTRGDRIRGAREADMRRDGTKGSGLAPGTRATDTTGSAGTTGTTGSAGTTDTTDPAGTTGTRAAVVAGHDTSAGRTAGRGEGRGDGGTPGFGESREDRRTTGSTTSGSAAGSPLLPHDECDKLTSRMHHAVGEFVDEPRSAVEEADHVLEEVTARFTDAMTQRRRTLRTSWQTSSDDRASTTDTEQLRLALRDYRELTERLLRI
ncbi:hypothetical protein [Streptomyces europaeiscabiei]|uniref:hypothetical protein n=1 Tax=Streptomyces europaeiscabiei TaxID=146819 RepID=UPI002E2BE690|nr:hypothetical protein [Streptomyces europaeiscabiei]